MVFTTLIASAELSIRHEEIHIVTANVVLRQVDNCSHQACLTMMVARLLGNITDKLGDLFKSQHGPSSESLSGYLDFVLELALEASPNDLPLTRFQAIRDRRD